MEWTAAYVLLARFAKLDVLADDRNDGGLIHRWFPSRASRGVRSSLPLLDNFAANASTSLWRNNRVPSAVRMALVRISNSSSFIFIDASLQTNQWLLPVN